MGPDGGARPKRLELPVNTMRRDDHVRNIRHYIQE